MFKDIEVKLTLAVLGLMIGTAVVNLHSKLDSRPAFHTVECADAQQAYLMQHGNMNTLTNGEYQKVRQVCK